MTDRKVRPAPTTLQVVRTERLSPHMQRVVAGGPSFATFLARNNDFTDRYVKLWFLDPALEYPDPLDIEQIRATMPKAAWPVVRTYTVRYVDAAAAELAIDFVVHGDEGIAGPWAAHAKPGDPIHLAGPGGAYSPDPHADWHLLVGDEAALPAIAAALERIPAGRPVHAFIEVDGPAEEQSLESPADLHLTWLHRDGAPAGTTTLLPGAVRSLDWPQGRPQVFAHGESSLLKTVRPYLIDERGVARESLSLSGYWRSGKTEEGFRAWKAEQNALESAAAGGETGIGPRVALG